MTSKIPGQFAFPIWTHCVMREIHWLHVASGTWCVAEIFPLHIQFTLVVRVPEEAVLWCQSLLRQLEFAHKLLGFIFQLGCSWPQILFIPNSRTWEVILESLKVPSAWGSKKDYYSQLQCRADSSHPILSWLGQGLPHDQFPVWSVQRLAVSQSPTWSNFSFVSQGREDLQSGCTWGCASSKNPWCLVKLVFLSWWSGRHSICLTDNLGWNLWTSVLPLNS